MTTSATDVLIVGGGLAGSAAAIALARAGRRVTLLERDREPRHKVCGEFLSAEANLLLEHLGVSPLALGAVPLRAVRFCSKHSTTAAALPFSALSLTRKRLDAALLQAAEDTGATVHRGASVQTLTRERQGWSAVTAAAEHFFTAPRVILASGKHDVRGFPRPSGVQGDLVGMKMYLRLAPSPHAALQGHVELLIHRHGYTGLQPVEDGAVNLCSVIRRSALTELGGSWPALLRHIRESSAHADARLAGAEPLLDRPLAIAPVPYGFLRRQAAGKDLWTVGDQAAVIPSFTGDGMSIALYSGLRAAQSLLRGETADLYQRQLHRDLRAQVAFATAISRALVHPYGRSLLSGVAHLGPAVLRWTAAGTRIPGSAIQTLALAG